MTGSCREAPERSLASRKRPPHTTAARFLLGLSVAFALVGAVSGCTVVEKIPYLSSAVEMVPLPPDVIYPSIEPVADAQPLPPVEFQWEFEGAQVRMSVPIDAAVYEGAKRSPMAMTVFRELSEAEWVPRYYRAIINEPSQEPLYDALLANFRTLRSTLSLDDDRYAELIVSWIQALEYHTDPVDLAPKFPIQTVGDRNGDCDDKTLLAAALLAREGYDVAVLFFAPEKHVALGIRTNGATFGRSGYALVESTAPSLFGWVPDTLVGGIVLASEPLAVAIGDGTRTYAAGAQTDALRVRYDEAIARSGALSREVEQHDAELQRRKGEVDGLLREMERLISAGDVAGHNALVPRFNALSDEHNRLVVERNAIAEEANALGRRINRINEGQSDRYGLVREMEGTP